eukprot:GHVP01065321.1.p2 GENE.GHVP01065321.1~~GHVP01065321.1.p2  ORF type:complete len:135 (-),score=15.42 GHVP01065321.1:665-1069(-)
MGKKKVIKMENNDTQLSEIETAHETKSSRSTENTEQVLEICNEIESAVKKQYKSEKEYRDRAIYFGLMDNAELCEKVKAKYVSAQELAVMPLSKMETVEHKEQTELLRFESIMKRTLSKNAASETTQFQCGKCG